MSTLTREQILAVADLPSEDVEVKEWGGMVRVRTLTAAERDAFLASVVGLDRKVDQRTYRTRLVAAAVVGEDGKPLFTPEEIGSRNTLIVDRLMEVANRLNTVDEAAVGDAEKNSERGPSDASSAAGR